MQREIYISIIVPVYYGKRYITSLIGQVEDCKKQLYKDIGIELILSNDAPDDRLEQIYVSDLINIVLINTDINRGIHGARVQGLKASRGEYVVFLDQDDKIFPEYISSQLKCIENSAAVVCRCIHEKKQFYNVDNSFEKMISKEYILKEGCPIISPGQVMLRKSSIPKVWMDNIMKTNCADDYFLWLCLAGNGEQFSLNQEILFEHIVEGNNTSWNMNRMIDSEHEMFELLRNNQVFVGNELKKLNELEEHLRRKHIDLLVKFRKMFMVVNDWLQLKEEGFYLDEYLNQKGIKKIAIYGAGYVGKRLKGELQGSLVEVKFFIDRNADFITEKIPSYTLANAPQSVDAIIITMVQGYEKVVEQLQKKYHVRIVTIRELISELVVWSK